MCNAVFIKRITWLFLLFLIAFLLLYWCFYLFTFNVYLFLKKRETVWVGKGQRETDTESEAGSRLWAVTTEPDAGLEPTNREIVTWAKVRRSTDWTTQAPHYIDVFKTKYCYNLSNIQGCFPSPYFHIWREPDQYVAFWPT